MEELATCTPERSNAADSIKLDEFVNTSGYLFTPLLASELPAMQSRLLAHAQDLMLKGTVLLSTEGINCFLSGRSHAIDAYTAWLSAEYPALAALQHKKSVSSHQPFTRLLVRIKKEIIAMGRKEIVPSEQTAPYVSPKTFETWCDEQRELVVLDTRNQYEVACGTFDGAVDLGIDTFRDFPDACRLLPESYKRKTVVTFCTGGIRCEKAAQHLINEGFESVYQLEGGVLNYFEQCGGAHWQGECFVFDKRVAVDSQLQETDTRQCYDCRAVLPVAVQDQPCVNCQGTAHLPG